VPLTVLPVRAISEAVGQNGLEPIEIIAPNVRTLIENNAGHLLTHALTHEMRLACVDFEPLLQRDPTDMDMESPQ
jgi:hypothetical protein